MRRPTSFDHAGDDDRLVRYIAGQCTSEEAAQVQQWIAAEPARWKRFCELDQIWRACGPARRWDPRVAWSTLRARRSAQLSPVRTMRRPAPLALWHPASRRASARVWIARVAACAALMLAGGLAWRALAARVSTSAAALPMTEIATANGQRAELRLSDGSRVILNAASTIRYARDFGIAAHRDVYLDGQAYFDVVHDARHPFVVHTSRGTAQDLGTAFVVTAYAELRDMQVVVASGSVALQPAASGPESPSTHAAAMMRPRVAPVLTLTTGELGLIDSTGAVTRRPVRTIAPYVGWTTGQLMFDGTPLRDAIPAIDRWYGVDITLGDRTLASQRLVAVFGQQSASEMMRLLALAVGARYEHRGHAIVLLSRHASPHDARESR